MKGSTSTPARVAIVEDDASLARSLARLLREEGFDPLTFASAEDFLASGTSDLACLLLDIQLGRMSGLELLEHLAAEGGSTPAIILTSLDDAALERRAHEAGCHAYLSKTTAGSELIASLRTSMKRTS